MTAGLARRLTAGWVDLKVVLKVGMRVETMVVDWVSHVVVLRADDSAALKERVRDGESVYLLADWWASTLVVCWVVQAAASKVRERGSEMAGQLVEKSANNSVDLKALLPVAHWVGWMVSGTVVPWAACWVVEMDAM